MAVRAFASRPPAVLRAWLRGEITDLILRSEMFPGSSDAQRRELADLALVRVLGPETRDEERAR